MGGVFRNLWVIPAGLIALVVGLSYLRFRCISRHALERCSSFRASHSWPLRWEWRWSGQS